MVHELGVIIEGRQDGAKFTIPLQLQITEDTMDVESAIIARFGSHVATFEELAVEEFWEEAYWTYPQSTLYESI